MTELKTSESLLRALKDSTARSLTPQELHEQRVSFIMGTLKSSSSITREMVREVLAKQEGQKKP